MYSRYTFFRGVYLDGKSSGDLGRKCHIERWMYLVIDFHDEEALERSLVESFIGYQ